MYVPSMCYVSSTNLGTNIAQTKHVYRFEVLFPISTRHQKPEPERRLSVTLESGLAGQEDARAGIYG